jgi:perosamine synthetase
MNPTTTSNRLPRQSVPAAKIDFLPEDRQWIAERIQEVLVSGQLTLGKYGAAFEEKFASFCGAKHAVAVNSGTAALEIIFRILDTEGKEVLVPANTNYATVAAIVRAGGIPVLLDTDPESFAIAPEEAERRLTPRTIGMVVVHIGGVVSRRMRELQELAKRRGIWLVEDAAHAHGSSYDGTSAGSFGIAGAFSFYPTKVMTCGEGGMVVTNDDTIAKEARLYRDQGKASFTQNVHVRLGYNWRLSEPHAIIGLCHLNRLPDMILARRHIASLYDDALEGWDSITPIKIPERGICNYYKYLVLPHGSLDRKALKATLRNQYGVSLSGEVYEEPIQKQPVFERYAHYPLPVSEDICARHLCLPVFASMTAEQAKQVVSALRATLGQ